VAWNLLPIHTPPTRFTKSNTVLSTFWGAFFFRRLVCWFGFFSLPCVSLSLSLLSSQPPSRTHTHTPHQTGPFFAETRSSFFLPHPHAVLLCHSSSARSRRRIVFVFRLHQTGGPSPKLFPTANERKRSGKGTWDGANVAPCRPLFFHRAEPFHFEIGSNGEGEWESCL